MASSFAFKAVCYAALLLPIRGADVSMNFDTDMNIDIADANTNYNYNNNVDIDNDSEAENGQSRIQQQVWIIGMRMDGRVSESANTTDLITNSLLSFLSLYNSQFPLLLGISIDEYQAGIRDRTASDDSNNSNTNSIIDELAMDRQLNTNTVNELTNELTVETPNRKKKIKKQKNTGEMTPAPTPVSVQVDDLTIPAPLNTCLLNALPQRSRKKARAKKKNKEIQRRDLEGGFDYTSSSLALESYIVENENDNYDNDQDQDGNDYSSEIYDFLFDDQDDDIMANHRMLQSESDWDRARVRPFCKFF